MLSEEVQVALIALVGVLLGGLLTGWFQRSNTRTTIGGEIRKLQLQLQGEAQSRWRARKQEWLLEAASELIVATDPELNAHFDYKQIVTRIHRMQLLLDRAKHDEGQLNAALNELGFAIQAAASGQRDLSRILGAQAAVTEATRAVLG